MLRLCGTSGAALSALGWSLLCPDAGIAFCKALGLRMAGDATECAGCDRGSIGSMEGRLGWPRAGYSNQPADVTPPPGVTFWIYLGTLLSKLNNSCYVMFVCFTRNDLYMFDEEHHSLSCIF